MFGIIKAQSYYDWLRREYARRQPASAQGLEECIRCGYCCCQRTCVPTPDELDGIATFLGLTVPGMIDKYMVGDEQEGHYFLRWANTGQQYITGEFLTNHDTFITGDCIFFENGICRIYDVLPRDARDNQCWKEPDDFDSRKEWKDGQLEQLCPDMDIDGDYDCWGDW